MAKKRPSATTSAAAEGGNPPRPPGKGRNGAPPPGTAPDAAAVPPRPPTQSLLYNNDVHKAAQLITLAALYAPVSQLSLSPVYGTAQAGLYHRWGTLATAFVAFLCVCFGQRRIPTHLVTILPAVAAWIPTLQFFLFQWSAVLPPPYGPLITEALTYYPLLFLSVYGAGQVFGRVDLSAVHDVMAEQVPTVGAYVLFTGVQRTFQNTLPLYMGRNILFSRIGLQVVLAALYGLALPAAPLWPAAPALAFTLLGNGHTALPRTTQVLNNTLALSNYTLLARRESVTGYLSVLENTDKAFRVLRCDHSLLGGQWTDPTSAARVPEPVFAVFAMLEAVRLVEPGPGAPRVPDAEKSALTIGLGVGTAPAALVAHGIRTTILELDPVVHEFARTYFGLPPNQTTLLGDAVPRVQEMLADGTTPFDIVLHDVFTGGAEPIDLFTFEFLSNVKALLKPDGVIAINYAGDLRLPVAAHVVRTIRAVFPSCRIFREVQEEDDDDVDDMKPSAHRKADFTNLVVFCKKSADAAVKFRKPTEADFLGSGASRAFLLPRYEVGGAAGEPWGQEGEVLRVGKTRQLERWQRESALGHWRIMRQVLPSTVWENW